MEKPSTKKPMNILKTMVFLNNFMKFTLWNEYTDKYIKIINVIDMRIEKTGSPAEQGFMDTQEWFIIYSTTGNDKMDVFKEHKIKYNPSYDHLQIINDQLGNQ